MSQNVLKWFEKVERMSGKRLVKDLYMVKVGKSVRWRRPNCTCGDEVENILIWV